MNDKQTLINVNQIQRYYGADCAVDGISFSVQRGEVLGFLGTNGAGKSTTMQIICGVLAATGGTVTVAGHDIVTESKLAKRHIGFLPENPPLYDDLTVDEYLKYCARLRQVTTNRITSALGDSKIRCGLQDHGGRLIASLSKGYKQRVGIAQAIIHSPSVVILDEPTSGLDPIQISEIRALIRELGEDHSVILSTHILPEVQSSCHRVLIINRGKLVLDENIHSLQGDTKQSSIIVALHKPPLLEELDKLEDVINIIGIDQFRFQIYFRRGSNVPQQLVNISAAAGWELFELIPQYDSLEQTFIRLAQGDAGQAASIDASS